MHKPKFGRNIYGFVWCEINICMNKFKNLKDDALTADWLRDIGLNNKTFNTAKLNVVRAQTMAHTLLSQHRDLLSKSQLHSLTDFQRACDTKRERERITDAFCYCVMNINTNINRKLFQQYRKLKKQEMTKEKI
jgi:hypothetical protein